ncbi:MAG: S9 family peptidase [Bacteroidota bacterium]
MKPPKAKKIDKALTIHGDTRIDNYYWLNDRENPDVIAYLNAENAYRENQMAHTVDFQKNLFDEIVGRIKQTDMSVPYKKDGYYYFTRYEEGKEYPIHARKKETLSADEEILLNVNELAKDFDYYAVGGMAVSTNNNILAFGEDTVSRRIYTLRFKDLTTGEFLPDRIENTTGTAVWANDNQTIFYTRKDDALRPYKIFRHVLGTDASEDVEIYHEADETFRTGIYKTKSKKYLVIVAAMTISTEYRILEADQPTGEFRIFQPREDKLEYSIGHFGDKFYVHTNWNAQNFRLMETSENSTTKESWQEVIPNRPDVLLEGMDLFQNYLVLTERINGISQIRVKPWAEDQVEHYIDFGQEAFMAYTTANYDFDTTTLRVGFTSMTTPNSIYDYDMDNRSLTLLKQQEVIGDFDANDYVSERHFATARDGVKVPISLVYKKGFKRDGKSPLLLYAYGSYGHSMDPYFSSVRLSLLDRGFVYAIAHIRGGEEMGRHWYDTGKMLFKKNTFNDFIDCAEYLLKKNYTRRKRLFAMGGSAGGLLMGAVINQRPELWRGIVAAVPFVDVVTTMLDESIPLTTGEFNEWGNPKDKEYYDYIKSYSPYDNIEKKSYPNMLVTTGLHDSQVQYWEPAKWVAKLRELKTGKKQLYLYTNMTTGHGGASGRFERFKETAMQYAFIFDLVGIKE